ncbi:unnamed protein product, partial [Didymodactylos carnosus]
HIAEAIVKRYPKLLQSLTSSQKNLSTCLPRSIRNKRAEINMKAQGRQLRSKKKVGLHLIEDITTVAENVLSNMDLSVESPNNSVIHISNTTDDNRMFETVINAQSSIQLNNPNGKSLDIQEENIST